MKKYLVLAFTDPANTQEEHTGGSMEDWGAWMEKMGDKVADMGAPLAMGVEGSGTKGFNEIKPDQWPAQGYMMIMAADMDEAQSSMSDSPLGKDMPLRIFEIADMPEMG